MRAGSQPPSDWWTASASIRPARHPQLPLHFRACGKRCRTGADAPAQRLKGHLRIRRFLRRVWAEEPAVEGFLPLPYSISFHGSGRARVVEVSPSEILQTNTGRTLHL